MSMYQPKLLHMCVSVSTRKGPDVAICRHGTERLCANKSIAKSTSSIWHYWRDDGFGRGQLTRLLAAGRTGKRLISAGWIRGWLAGES